MGEAAEAGVEEQVVRPPRRPVFGRKLQRLPRRLLCWIRLVIEEEILDSKTLQAALGLVTLAAMHPQNAMLETAQELRSARPRTGEPSATFGCTEASTPAWPSFHVHSINASVGPSPDETTTATWRYQRNQQYSITAVTTSSGSVVERYAYTAYGQPTILDGSGSVLSSSAINNRYTYTGREWDATLGLYHFRARWMSGIAGRFMGRDPIKYRGGENLYRANFGLGKADPDGTDVIALPAVWGAAVAEPSPLGEIAAAGVTAIEIGAVIGVAIGVADLTRRCFCTYRFPNYQKCSWLDQTIDPASALKNSMQTVEGWSGPFVQKIRNKGAANKCPGGSPGIRYAAEVVYYYQDTVSGKFITYTIDFPVNCCACCNIFTVGVSCRQIHPGKGSGGVPLPPAR